jgi:hypothetical protein
LDCQWHFNGIFGVADGVFPLEKMDLIKKHLMVLFYFDKILIKLASSHLVNGWPG